jgi:signal transduction histidine kinase
MNVTIRVGPLGEGFYIEDDGPGIPDEMRETVFDHGVTTATDGNGYGLSIVRTIANAHGWDIVATEAASGGARFEITGLEFLE